jgi:hypothetical protein
MKRVTPLQLRILRAMYERGVPAAFIGENARKHGFGVLDAKGGGIVIRACANPEFFMARRGLIERQKLDRPGAWYRLTDSGRIIAVAAGSQERHRK